MPRFFTMGGGGVEEGAVLPSSHEGGRRKMSSDRESSNTTTPSDRVSLETVNILFTLSGNDTEFLSEWAVAFKSVLMNAPVDHDMTIHILCDQAGYGRVKYILIKDIKLSDWKSRNQITVDLHNVQNRIQGWEHFMNVTSNSTKLSYKHSIGTYFRLFAHEVILDDSARHVIYLDTDVAIFVNLEEIWTHCDDSVMFQWGTTKTAGFMIFNLPLYRAHFWKYVKELSIKYGLRKAMHGKPINDQRLLQAVEENYSNTTALLPDAWDTHVAAGAWGWKTIRKVLKMRPEMGFLHINGGAWSKSSAFDSPFLTTDARFNTTYLAARYYATFPWLWAKFFLASQIGAREGYPVKINYS